MLTDRPVLFFGGKGGVGKTTLASAFALASAERERRTLLVSTDPAHSTGDMLEVPLGPEPTPVLKNLWAIEIDPTREADRYIAEVKDRIADVTPPRLAAEVERQIDIARVTPGAEEAALFERFTRLIDTVGGQYDRMIFDTAPLGHTLRLLALPEHMTAWMEGLIGRRKKVNVMARMWRRVAGTMADGPSAETDPVLAALEERRERFQRARDVICDARRTAFVFVTIPERLPVLETGRAVETLKKHGIPVGAVIANRILPEASAESFYAQRRAREAERLAELRDAVGTLPVYGVPLLETEVHGVVALRRIVGALSLDERAGLPR